MISEVESWWNSWATFCKHFG